MMLLEPQDVLQSKPPPAIPLPSSICPIPWATSAFSPHNGLLKRLLRPPSYIEAGEKLTERNLDADLITEISIT